MAKAREVVRRLFGKRGPGLLIFALIAPLYLAGGFDAVELKLMDARFWLHQQVAPTPASGQLILVEIDAKSLQAVETWPWPRSYHGNLIHHLTDAGVRRIAFDLVFSSLRDPLDDAVFAEVLETSQIPIYLAALRERVKRADGHIDIIHTEPDALFLGNAQMASINVHPDGDGLIRRMVTAYPWPRETLPTFASVLADRPTSAGVAEYWIDYGIDTTSVPRLSYVDVMTGRFDPALIRGRDVLIGATALELNDELQVPLYGAMEGPLIQVLAAETMRRGPLLRIAPAIAAAGALLMALLLGHRFTDWSWRRGLFVIVLTGAAIFALSMIVQHQARTMVDISPLVAVVVLSYSYAVFRRIDQQSLSLFLQGAEIRRKDVMMRHVVESSFDGILTMDRRGIIKLVNPAAEAMFGYPADQIVGRHIGLLLLDDGQPLVDESEITALLSKGGPVELDGRRQDGRSFPIDIAISAISLDDEPHMTAVVRDITLRKQQSDALRHQALHDALTNLPNRSLLFDRIEQGIRLSRRGNSRLALLLIDLDRFKDVNDTLGHHVGDNLLQGVARRLRSAVRDSDTIARLGGDEFAVLLPQVDAISSAGRIAEKLRGSLEKPFELNGLALEVGASVGIAVFPDHGTHAADLIQKADVAMYTAKTALLGQAFYDAEKDHHSVRHLTLSGELRRAIEEDQLELHFQPKVDLAQQRVCGAEALVRWHHPDHGFMPPDEFIHVAENTGLIQPLTDWVLREALAQWNCWRSQGFELGIAVNLSARQLQDQTLPETFVQMLAETGTPETALTLEVTESAIMADPARALTIIRRLHDLGIHLAIDDFGTGYSSLAYLKDLPASELKIDKSFVKDMCRNEGDQNIVQSTINLAHNLGLKAVAEGIEDEDVLQLLDSLSCNIGQGYFFSRPLAAKPFIEWLRESPWGLGQSGKPDKRSPRRPLTRRPTIPVAVSG